MTEETAKSRKILRCWEPGPAIDDGCSTTCMLEKDHQGPHEWTRDDQIIIHFAPRESTP